jgi:O-antigen/teichoic acid export membrane protein
MVLSSPEEAREYQDGEGAGERFQKYTLLFLKEHRHHGAGQHGEEDETTMVLPAINRQPSSGEQKPFIGKYKSGGDLYYPLVDGILLEEQATWIIPAVQIPRAAKSEVDEASVQSYTTQLRNLLKSSGIYALASFAAPLVSLILSPYLTRHLSHTNYGLLTVLTTAIALLAGLTQLGLGSAFFRLYNYDYESPQDRRGILAAVFILLLGSSTPVIVIVLLTAPFLAALLLNDSSLASLVRLAIFVVLIQNLTVPGFAWMRAENRAVYFALLSIANLLITLGTTLLLVGKLQMGVAGSLIATGAGYGAVVICTLPLIIRHAGLRCRFDIAWGLLSFGLPNVSNFVSVWILQLADRFLLARMGSFTMTATYSVAYSLGGVLGVVVLAPFQLAWPSVLFRVARRKDAARIFALVFRWYGLVLLLAAYALSLLATAVLKLFFPPSYGVAAAIIPVITLSTLCYGLYNFFTLGIGIRRKTWLAVIFTSSSALLNVVLNLVLIPYAGSMGAALATLFAYVFLVCIVYIVNQYIYSVDFEMGLFLMALLVGIVLYAMSELLAQGQSLVVGWSLQVGLLCLFAAFLALAGKSGWKMKALSSFLGRIFSA